MHVCTLYVRIRSKNDQLASSKAVLKASNHSLTVLVGP